MLLNCGVGEVNNEILPFETTQIDPEGFPGSSAGKESACNAGDPGLTPGSGRSPGEENGYPVQYSHGILAWKIPWTEEPGENCSP